MRILVALLFVASAAAQTIPTPNPGDPLHLPSSAGTACAGTPGNTTLAQNQFCVDSNKAVWVCAKVGGCSVAADVSSPLPGMICNGSTCAIDTTVLPGTAIATTALTTVNLIAGNNGQQIAFTAGTNVTLNIPLAVAVKGFTILIIQRGAGTVTPTAPDGVTIRQRQSYTKTAGQYAVATLSCDIAGDCILAGDLQ